MTRRLVPGTSQDLARVEAIVRAAYTPYETSIGVSPGPLRDDYAAYLADGRVWLTGLAGRVDGLLVLLPLDDAMLLDNVAVDPSAQGQGLGRWLVCRAFDLARGQGFDRIRLYTHVRMERNIRLYRSLGFAETHRVVEKGLDRVYFEASLSPAGLDGSLPLG